MELQSKWARMLFYGPLLGGCMIPMTAASVLAGAWAPSLVASAGLGVVAGLWRASARRHKAYALESVLPRMRARLGGLLEREDVQVVEVQRYDGGGSR